jgi:hypothetical protein
MWQVFYVRKKLEYHVRLVHGTLLPPEAQSDIAKVPVLLPVLRIRKCLCWIIQPGWATLLYIESVDLVMSTGNSENI